MIWAAGAMVLFHTGIPTDTNATLMVGKISRYFLGSIGAIFAILGVIVLPITSGDTALRSLRLMIAESFNIDQTQSKNRIKVSSIIFVVCTAVLIFSKINPDGFNLLWRYFAFTNQSIGVFALAMISAYLMEHHKSYLFALIPGMFYCMIVTSYIFHASIGFGIEPRLGQLFGVSPESYGISYILGAVCTILYAWATIKVGRKRQANKQIS